MVNPMWAVVALVAGSLVTGVIYAVIKKKPEEAEEVEEEIVELDIDLNKIPQEPATDIVKLITEHQEIEVETMLVSMKAILDDANEITTASWR